ncbi:hypothetical protein [Kitasatospora griseola]|uniref:hypothetical protein n=1 Tax=Kitasatospora griseola TaxID=2064 RepID=UPI000B0E5D39|nr:hypothetical protein [Kitasatospora griseola]
MLSHDSLLRRIETIEQAASDPFLIDRVLTDIEHNDRARLLRNGLMVVAFTSLEDFIRARTGELLESISRTVLPFSDLPEMLQTAATMGAMRAARSRAEMAKSAGEDAQALLQEAAAHVASTAGGALQLSRYSLGYSGSNVSSSEIAGILATFHASDAWNEITSIASRCGAGSMPLKAAYDQAIQLRHSAAHRPDANVQPRDLQNFCSQAVAIALGFDIIASRAARLIREGDPAILAGKVKLSGAIKIRFLDAEARGSVERKEGVARAVSVNKDATEALKNAARNASLKKEPLVSRGPSLLPVRWVITDLT